MRVRAQVGMVMNLDKCIGCHTCSVTCKQVWTNRPGAEYMWFNDVETKPGLGYPKRWEDQEHWRGGWELDRKGRLRLKAGGRVKKLLSIFSNPDLPQIDDYYEPWTYDYEKLITAPLSDHDPVARARSQLTGKALEGIRWGPNWDDNLAGTAERIHEDPLTRGIEEQVKATYEQAFMFYLPRICEHCLNPSCVASCPSGAMYKREEDGIVLVDQAKCRGWRFCVSGCPYKKVYFNHRTGKAEKCTLCYPRIEIGLPTICSETCVGRIRYIGLVLYDSDRVEAAASVPDQARPARRPARRVPRPGRPRGARAGARATGSPTTGSTRRGARRCTRSRTATASRCRCTPSTGRCRWCGTCRRSRRSSTALETDGYEADPDHVFPAIEAMRIPVDYLANLLAAGDGEVIRDVLRRLAAMRGHMRKREVLGEHDEAIAAAAGMSVDDVEDMYRLLAIAKYEDRYVIPQAHAELGRPADGAAGHVRPGLRGRPGQLRRDRLRLRRRERGIHAHRRAARRARHRPDARRPAPRRRATAG